MSDRSIDYTGTPGWCFSNERLTFQVGDRGSCELDLGGKSPWTDRGYNGDSKAGFWEVPFPGPYVPIVLLMHPGRQRLSATVLAHGPLDTA